MSKTSKPSKTSKTLSKNDMIERQKDDDSEENDNQVIELVKPPLKKIPKIKQGIIDPIIEPIIIEKKKISKQVIVESIVEEPIVELKKEKQPMSEAKHNSLLKARETRQLNLLKKKEYDNKSKKIIEHIYRTEVEANLTKTLLPKYEKKIKKQLLEKLKARKLEELKKKYNYQSSDSEESESSESDESEEEIIPIKKQKSKSKTNNSKPTVMNISDRYK